MSKIVMGLSAGHTRGAAITVDGELKVAIANERLTRIKDDRSESIAIESMDYCIDTLGITYDDIDLFVYNITEEVNKVPEEFQAHTGQSLDKLKFIPHHIAHAYSTFAASGYKDGVVVIADAMGSVYNDVTPIKEWYQLDESDLKEGQEWAEGFSIYEFKDGNITPQPLYKKWVRYPFDPDYQGSIGYFYGVGSKQLVYSPKTNTWQAGKLMGLASYADPNYVNQFEDFSIRTENDLQVPAFPVKEHEVNWQSSDFQAKANVAGLYQREQEKNSMHLVEMASRLSDSKNVCVAGGSFLNCNTNELIIRSGLFENQYFMPPADDSGIPHGCAYAGAAYLMNEIRTGKWMSPYTGRTYQEQDILSAAKEMNLVATKLEGDALYDTAASFLQENKVIAWMQGGSETGPRALGNRSILANPSAPWMMDFINSEVKKREWYRPFAPSVLFEKQGEIFDLDTYSPYMLVTTTVKEEWRKKIPAVVHHDYTSRYQSVTQDNNPRYHNLISAFYNKTGIPVVLNTSFNGPEEPIVETPLNAMNTMINHGLYAVFVGDYMITRK